MKVLFVHNRYRLPGGEDRAVQLEMDLLTTKGHEVKALFFDNHDISEGFTNKVAGFINAVFNRSSAAQLRHNILEFRPDIIHFHNIFFVASPSVLREAFLQGVPSVVTLHNYRTICSNALLLRNNKPCEICVQKKLPLSGIRYACYRGSSLASAMVTLTTGLPKLQGHWSKWVSRYIVLTPFAEKKFIDSSLGARDQQIMIKPNFVTDPGVGDLERGDFFLFVGRISAEKGVDVLLEAFRDLPAENILIAGEGPEKDALAAAYRDCTNINFLGSCSQTEVISLMKKSKALLFPSIWYEGLPFVILEAFSTGTPIIASNLGAMASLIKDGYNGLVFKPGSAKELKSAILRFNTNASDMYQHARETYLSQYHPDIHYQTVMKIYDQSIQATREKRAS